MRRGKSHLNICLVSREYPGETGWGGIGRYTYHLAHGLIAAGHNVHVLAQSLSDDKEYLDNGVIVHRISHRVLFPFKYKLQEFGNRIEYSYHIYNKLKELVNRYEIDIVEGPNLSAETFIYSFFKKTPLVTRVHTHFSEVVELCNMKRTRDIKFSCLMEDSNILRSDMVTCSTQSHARTVLNEIGCKPSHVEIIPLGIPLPEIDKWAYEAKNKDSFTVLYVGRLEKRKGANILATAIPYVLKQIPETKFQIIGRDTYLTPEGTRFTGDQKDSFKEKMVRDITGKYIDRVHFLGYVDDDDLADYYRSCHVFVAPSLYESFGFIYIEAMSYGKPVIGCDVGGVPEVVRDGITGLLVPQEDPYLLAGAIIRVLKDRGMREEMGIEARKHVEANFTRELMTERTVQAYQKFIR